MYVGEGYIMKMMVALTLLSQKGNVGHIYRVIYKVELAQGNVKLGMILTHLAGCASWKTFTRVFFSC